MTNIIARMQEMEIENSEMRQAFQHREQGFRHAADQYRQQATAVADQWQAAAAHGQGLQHGLANPNAFATWLAALQG